MSEPVSTAWTATNAWAVPRGRGGSRQGEANLRLALVENAPMSTLIVRQGRQDALAALVREHFGCDLPTAGKVSFGPNGDIVWSSPGQWLVIGDATGLRSACADLAAFTDQGSSRALIEVSGSPARDGLAKGFAIDLHPSVFATGATAVTAVAHMSVQIWQADDSPRFVIAVPRSLAGSFWSWLDHASAPYGYEVTRSGWPR